MKKYLLILLAVTTSIYAMAADYHSLEEIRDQWTSRNIKVPKGGNNPGIVQLVKAFQDTWHAYTVSPVLEKAKNPNFTYEADEENGGGITVDRKNGYVSLDNGASDSGYPISHHQLSFYPNVVVTKTDVYQYTCYAFLKDGYVLQMINEYPTLVSADGRPKITVEGWEELNEEAAREMIKSLGQPIVINPQWRKVRLND